MSYSISRLERIASLCALVLLLFTCYRVLQPFIFDLVWAAILCFVTWPLYERLRAGGMRPALAATLMVVPVSILLLTPFVTAAFTLTDDVNRMLQWLNHSAHTWPDPPGWLTQLPYMGETATEYWESLGDDSNRIFDLGRKFALFSGRWVLEQSINLAAEILHVGLSILILFFFYRDGESVAGHFIMVIQKLAGEQTQRILQIIRSSLRAVVYGILGTALVQALASLLGLLIAGVPYPFALGMLSFFLSIIPAAMNFLWIPIAAWLMMEGEAGWAIFIILWFVLFVGTIDNWLRPILISREVELPFILIMFGIFGGLLAFGFIGLFLGPTLLATGFALITDWVIRKEKESIEELKEQK